MILYVCLVQSITVVLIRASDARAVPTLAVESGEITILGIAIILVSAVSGLSRSQDKQAEDDEGRGHGGVEYSVL